MKLSVPTVKHLESFLDRMGRYGQTTTAIVLSSPITHRVVQPPDGVVSSPVSQASLTPQTPVLAAG